MGSAGICASGLAITEEGVSSSCSESRVACVDAGVEVEEALLGCFLVKLLVEGGAVFVTVGRVFPVVVDTIGAEVHQAVDERLYILEVAVAVLFRDKLGVGGIAASCGPAFKELDTGEDVRTVAVGSVSLAFRKIGEVLFSDAEGKVVYLGTSALLVLLTGIQACRAKPTLFLTSAACRTRFMSRP